MRLRKSILGMVFALAAGLPAGPMTALAADTIYIPLMTYRTGPFANVGVPIANGMADYLNMLNARDGGIGGVKLRIEECETSYDPRKGVECYESTREKNPVVTNPYSTAITLQLIPRASVDKIPILSFAYGLSASADGNTFPWIFNPPSTYWDGASSFIKYVAQEEGGVGKLKGKKIGLIHLDVPYGREPIPLLEALARDYGFTLKLYPVAPSEMENQTSVWLGIRRDRPDWLYMQGLGTMSSTAIGEAVKTGYPMSHFIGNWWTGVEDDARSSNPGSKGYLSLDFNQVGQNFPAIRDILKYVVDKGESRVAAREKVGENFYNRGVLNSVYIAEAIRNAQRLTGNKVITGADMRRGLETLNIDQARLKALGLDGFAAPVQVTCADHSGHDSVYVAEWDGATWTKKSDWIDPIKDKVLPLIYAAAKEYKTSHPGWPKRTEGCDR